MQVHRWPHGLKMTAAPLAQQTTHSSASSAALAGSYVEAKEPNAAELLLDSGTSDLVPGLEVGGWFNKL